MPLSPETLAALEESKVAVEEYRDRRIAEIDDLVANLKAYGVPLDSLASGTTEAAVDEALSSLTTLLS